MTHPTRLVWEGRWPLADDFHVHARVYASPADTYRLVLDYPPIAVAGEPEARFTLVAGTGMSWADLRRYLARCHMSRGWTPTPLPDAAPTLPLDEPLDTPGQGGRSAIFRPRRRPPSPSTRRVPSHLVDARRRGRPRAQRQPEASGAA